MNTRDTKIKITNQLWSRRCNLACTYCKIATTTLSKYYHNKPEEYPDSQYYIHGEKDGDWWIDLNKRLYNHNNDNFNILYGGEIFLHKDHVKIIKALNDIGCHYTIITSANDGIRKIIDNLFKEVDYIHGVTCSIDPGFWKDKVNKNITKDEIRKSHTGYGFLKELIETDRVKDPVAEITVSRYNIKDLEKTVKMLTDENITSSITCIDKAHNPYYDFSTIESSDPLVKPDMETESIFRGLCFSEYKIHMKKIVLQELYRSLPSNGDCELDILGTHNISIEPTGELRLCLRIRGTEMVNFSAMDLLNEDGSYNENNYDKIMSALKHDKDQYCRGCNWTCPIMSKFDSNRIINH